MQETSSHFTKRRKSPEHALPQRSPYFASVRRNPNQQKNRMSAQNAILITKYPSAIDEAGRSKKKKVFKRFNKFEQIDQLYTAQYLDSKLDKKSSSKEHREHKHEGRLKKEDRIYSNPKDILYSSKTLALAEKYSSYKSILMSTPKIKQQKQKTRRNSNFRTKTKSGNSVHWINSSKQKFLTVGLNTGENSNEQIVNEDWLCKQLIQNEVYGIDQDDDTF